MLRKDEGSGLAILFIFLFVLATSLVYFDYKEMNKNLVFAMLDIGQGDAIFVQSPTGTQMLIDGGPAKKILGPLSRAMPIFDKKIDAILITNPDTDHIAGFLGVLKNYKVGRVFEPGTFNDSKTYLTLEEEIKNQKISDTLVRKNMRIDLGGGAVMEILFPDRDVSLWSSNDGSVIAKLIYGETSIMLTGDATAKTEHLVLLNNPKNKLASTILKVGHHGSRTSSSSEFIKAVKPMYALISDGKNNKYGHPHQETLDTLSSFKIKSLRTDLLGSIILNTDGKNVKFSYQK